MKIEEFNYHLPPELIAQTPAGRRDESRLMVVDRKTGSIHHQTFKDLPKFITLHDLLVLNNSKVFPARLFAHRPERDESIEVLLIKEVNVGTWQVLARPGKKLKPGTHLIFKEGSLEAEVIDALPDAPHRLIRFSVQNEFWDQLEVLGRMPLPPYIRRGKEVDDPHRLEDRHRYQTVYARERGSIAAPTAGLHFTAELLRRFNHCAITLHVGYGTFKPVTSERVTDHTVDPEVYSVSRETASKVRDCRERGGRIAAVGTTTTRTLETIGRRHGTLIESDGVTDLFIYPGFRFRIVDCLVTNFHLPGSSLILLAAAFAGKELLLSAYREAVRERYRFYSYGDAMLIL